MPVNLKASSDVDGKIQVPLLPREPRNVDEQDELEDAGIRNDLETRFLKKLNERMRILSVLDVFMHVIRNAMPIAALYGLDDALHLKGNQFNTLIAAVYVGQMLADMLFRSKSEGLIGRWFGFLPACMIVFGALSILCGLTNNFIQTCFVRVALGFVEVAFLIGYAELRSKWYKGDELKFSLRGVPFSNVVGFLTAAFIVVVLDGVLGVPAWRWLFYIQGVAVVAIGVYASRTLPGVPETATWLTELEHRLVEKRTLENAAKRAQYDSIGSSKSWSWSILFSVLLDWKVWYMASLQIFISLSLSFQAFWPIIVGSTLGSGHKYGTLLLCAATWIVPAVLSAATATHFWHIRGKPLPVFLKSLFFVYLCTVVLAELGIGMAWIAIEKPLLFCSLFLMPMLYVGQLPLHLIRTNGLLLMIDSPAKRSASVLFIECFAFGGKILGSYLWTPRGAEKGYERAFNSSVSSTVMGMLAFSFYLKEYVSGLKKKAAERENSEMLSVVQMEGSETEDADKGAESV